MKITSWRAVFLAVAAASTAFAGPLTVFSRPLNNTPGNIAIWSPGGAYVLGDDFTLSQTTVIDSLTVWFAASDPATTNPDQEMSAINLYLGADPPGTSLPQVAGAYGFFPDGTFGSEPLFAIKFSGLDFTATAGITYNFVVEGIPKPGKAPLALTSTPCANLNGPCPGDGADAIFLAFVGTEGVGPYDLSFTIPGSGTDGVADINVSIDAVPEPSTFALLTIGLAFSFFLRRKAS